MVEGISLEEELVSWASQRPAWQQNILHELATGADITKINFSKLAQDLVADKPMAATLTLSDLPNTTSSDAAVRLVAIQNVTGVNRLAPDQILDFPTEGITVVFGNNGSGKSGYARILTQVVRSRRQATIYSNVFETRVEPGAELIAGNYSGLPW
ncbi:ATP-binding protein [Ferrimicrobium acidiphilum]|uniref:ATP-binding protein n=1 Tax=Ferrimicrobium acidiphilum TaxID=121039 RepID=UPI0023F28E08|nr:ATP-binding protein [Ferrimicrobium acidiphilum]